MSRYQIIESICKTNNSPIYRSNQIEDTFVQIQDSLIRLSFVQMILHQVFCNCIVQSKGIYEKQFGLYSPICHIAFFSNIKRLTTYDIFSRFPLHDKVRIWFKNYLWNNQHPNKRKFWNHKMAGIYQVMLL